MDYRPTADVGTFRKIARHILYAGEALTGLLMAGEEVFGGPDFRDKLKPHFRDLPKDSGAAELAAALRDSVARRTVESAAKSPEFYKQTVSRFGDSVTRLEMLQFIKEHELTHRQQLFMYLRLKGVVPATTRRRMAQAAK